MLNLSDDTIIAAQAGSKEAQGRVLDRMDRLIKAAVRKLINSSVSSEDLIQDARVAVLEALCTFDASKGFSFETYTYRIIRGSIFNAAGSYYQGATVPSTTLTRYWAAVNSASTDVEAREAANMDGVTFDAVHSLVTDTWSYDMQYADMHGNQRDADELGDIGGGGLLSEPAFVQDFAGPLVERLDIDEILDTLDPRERVIVELAYGFSGDGSLTDVEVSAIVGIERSRVNRIRNRALAKMAPYVRAVRDDTDNG